MINSKKQLQKNPTPIGLENCSYQNKQNKIKKKTLIFNVKKYL